jgi:ferredoxin/flavodoxin---NADP+ reductase
LAEPTLNAVVALRTEISPWLIILRVVPDGWEMPEFTPGQFGVIGLPGSAPRTSVAEPEDPPAPPDKLIRRAYSIASSSRQREYIEYYIALVTSGALTPRLFNLKIGDRIWHGPKITGMFTLNEVPEDKNIVLIATGTGLAPFMSMLTSQMVCGSPRHFAVLHGARHSWDLGYRSELLTLQHLCSNFSYTPVISRPQHEPYVWPGATGYVQDLWEADVIAKAWGFAPTADNTHVFLCGSPSMIDDVVPLLGHEGFVENTKKVPGQVHVERYW